MEPVFSAADDAGHAQHASFIRTGELVLEVARDHVAHFSERIHCLSCGVGRVPQHSLGNLVGGLRAATHRHHSAQRPGQPDDGGKSAGRLVFGWLCQRDLAAQHDLEDFLRCPFEKGQPVLLARRFGKCGDRSHGLSAADERGGDQLSSCRRTAMGAPSNSRTVSRQVPSAREWKLYSPPLMTVGTLNMHRSSVPESLFLKLPAIMLQISPSASAACSWESAVSPSMRLAISPAVFASQQTVRIPHSAPAKPTMAVHSSFGLFSDGAATFTRQPTIISKTSSTASSIMGSQFSS